MKRGKHAPEGGTPNIGIDRIALVKAAAEHARIMA
jgi:hypothetical protein